MICFNENGNDVMTVEGLMEYLSIGKTTAYKLLKSGKIKIAVCDSDMEVAHDLKNLIEGENIAATVKIFSSAADLLAAYASVASRSCFRAGASCASADDFHICFLDIKGIDGLKLAQKIRQREEQTGKTKSVIIFVTGYSEHMEDAFDVHAFHYLVKPVNKEKFRHVLQDALKEIETLRQAEKYILVSMTDSETYSSVKRKIFLKDILYVESDNKKVIVHMDNEILRVQGTMNEFESVCGKNFYRCHRCYLVNFAKITAYSQNEITVDGGDKIMLAYKKYTAFVKAYLAYAKEGGTVNV